MKQLFIFLITLLLFITELQSQRMYTIQNAATNAIVDANSDRFTVFRDLYGSSNELWKFVEDEDGYYQIVNITKENHALQAVTCCGADATKIYNWNFNGNVDDSGLWQLEPHPEDPTLVRFLNKEKEVYMIQPSEFNSTNPLQLEINSPKGEEFGLNSYFRIVPRGGSGGPEILNSEGNLVKLEREYRYSVPLFVNQFQIFGIPESCEGETALGGETEYYDTGVVNTIETDLSAGKYGLAERGDYMNLKIYAIGNSYDNESFDNTVSLTSQNDADWGGTVDKMPLDFEYITTFSGDGVYYAEYPIYINFGSPDLRLTLDLIGGARMMNNFNSIHFGTNVLEFPLRSSGIISDVVDSIGTTTDPELPYIVLRDPPGGASYSQILAGEKICQSITQESTLDQSGTVDQSLKIGIAGEAGVIVTTAFEFSTTFSSSGTKGDVKVESGSQGTCFEATETITTSKKPSNSGAASDVYVTIGYDLKYGIAEVIDYDPDECGAFKIDTQMVYAPIPGSIRTRLMSRKSIKEDIENQQIIVDDSLNVGLRATATAQYQMDAWKEFLLLDSLSKLEALESEKVDGFEIAEAGTALNKTFSVQTTQQKSIQTSHYIDNSFGISTKVAVAGSGFSAGYKYTSKKKFGTIQASNEVNTNKLGYTLQDNEGGDRIVVDVYDDPIYGTPIFKLDPNSRTSCPYEGGLQRDQPRIEFSQNQDNVGQENVEVIYRSDDTITVRVPKDAEQAVVALDLCNDNTLESRFYRAQLLSNSNKAGAVVTLGGKTISADDDNLQDFTVGAGRCEENFLLRLEKAPNIYAYEDLVVRLFNECDTASSRTDYLVLNIFFEDEVSSSLDDELLNALQVFPNPVSTILNVDFGDYSKRVSGMEIINANGELLYNEQFISGDAKFQNRTIDLSNFVNGIYFLRLRTQEELVYRKFIVSKD